MESFTERLKKEMRLLQSYNVQARLFNLNTRNPYVLMPAITNRGRIYGNKPYTLRMDLNGFPINSPDVSTSRMLYTKGGKPLNKPQHGMHCLGTKHGGTLICHYGSSWSPNVTLFKVFLKCRMWLEAYEEHLETGMKLDYYLPVDYGQEERN